MADSSKPHRSTSLVSSSASLHQNGEQDIGAIRPRNRRLISTEEDVSGLSARTQGTGSRGMFEGGNRVRSVSPLPSARIGTAANTRRTPNPGGDTLAYGLLEGSWAPSWASVQGFASSFLTGGERSSKNNKRSTPAQLTRDQGGGGHREPNSWGPAPPSKVRPGVKDIASGSLVERESALIAAKRASVLESYDGVNGGLDVSGKFKWRTSDDIPRTSGHDEAVEEHLVYIHHIQPDDTYAGVVLKYRCREDALKKANGLWSRDDIKVRKWLAIPVDECEVKGRPCQPPSVSGQGVDLLAPTPDASEQKQSHRSPFGELEPATDFFSFAANGSSAEAKAAQEERPWAHVRWVTIDSLLVPVEIGRVTRKATGYFPPRRRKSLHTASTLSTPRQSVDLSSAAPGSVDAGDLTAETSSSRHSLLGGRPPLSSTPTSTRSRMGSGGADTRPAWMRRPGGVGSMGRNVRAPGPEKDYLNSWARKHFPGLNIEAFPSMSVMGSETASFGFGQESASIVESPFDQGHDLASTSRQGSGLDRAAATVETWLRGAFASVKGPGTPTLGPKRTLQDEGDLIELADTNSDDGRAFATGNANTTGLGSSLLVNSAISTSSGRSDWDASGSLRDRPGMSKPKGKKID